MEANISCNGNKSVMNCIMGVCALIAMGTIKKWTLVASMGCVHTQREILTIEGCGNPSHVRNVVEKDGEYNEKVAKTKVMKSPLAVRWFLLYLPNVLSTFFSRIS